MGNLLYEKQQGLQIELDGTVGEGTYANLAIVSHSLSEFILDFVRVMPNMPKAKVKSRIVLTPEHAKGLMQALQQQVQKYEEEYGPIRDGNPSGGRTSTPFPINFGNGGEA